MKGIMGASVIAVCFFAVVGCAGNGDLIPVNVALKPSTVNMTPPGGGGPTVAVVPFEDSRAERSKLGTRHSVWGRRSDFTPQGGSLSEATAQALASYLTKRGWQAYLASGAAPDVDVVISGRILDLSVNAYGAVGGTEIVAKSKLIIQTKNRIDSSSITETVSHTGNYHVLWFEPQDGEDLLTDVLEKNFEKFAANTRADGKSVRFR